jgi:hypothetical protein
MVYKKITRSYERFFKINYKLIQKRVFFLLNSEKTQYKLLIIFVQISSNLKKIIKNCIFLISNSD